MSNLLHKFTDESKLAKTKRKDIRSHYKLMYNTARAIKNKNLVEAKKYLKDVQEHKAIVPFMRYNGSTSRHRGVLRMTDGLQQKGRWPKKSSEIVYKMLLNLENNANLRNLDTDNLTIQHVQCNIAQVGRRRTYRAHGRVGRWNSSNCHLQLIVGEKETEVRKFAKD